MKTILFEQPKTTTISLVLKPWIKVGIKLYHQQTPRSDNKHLVEKPLQFQYPLPTSAFSCFPTCRNHKYVCLRIYAFKVAANVTVVRKQFDKASNGSKQYQCLRYNHIFLFVCAIKKILININTLVVRFQTIYIKLILSYALQST